MFELKIFVCEFLAVDGFSAYYTLPQLVTGSVGTCAIASREIATCGGRCQSNTVIDALNLES